MAQHAMYDCFHSAQNPKKMILHFQRAKICQKAPYWLRLKIAMILNSKEMTPETPLLEKHAIFQNFTTESKGLMTPENIDAAKQKATPTQPTSKHRRLRGVTRLYRACEKLLRNDSDRIAQALLERAMQGNVSSAKLLIKIVELEARRTRTRKPQAPQRKFDQPKPEKKHLAAPTP